jgi:TPP-dependent indolepyruvate ferredoxin oxidoreductase alpha subunit
MKGVEAAADALRRYTDRQYTVPGFPITELGALTRAELVINEKTALEYALGDSLMGRRAAVIVKNVGVNACADPLLQATTQGLIGGVMLVAGTTRMQKGRRPHRTPGIMGNLQRSPS